MPRFLPLLPPALAACTPAPQQAPSQAPQQATPTGGPSHSIPDRSSDVMVASPTGTRRPGARPGTAAQGPIPEAVPASGVAAPAPSAGPAEDPTAAAGRRTLSTAFVRVGPDGHLTVGLRDGRSLVLRHVTMGPKTYCGTEVAPGSGRFCGAYADVAAASPGGVPPD